MFLTTVCTIVLLTTPAAHAQEKPGQPAAAAAPAVAVPDTAAGRALQEFVASFNAGGDKRRAWLKERTTLETGAADEIFTQDTGVLGKHGAMTIIRVVDPAANTISAIVRHATTGMHGHLTIEVQPEAPNKVANMQLRGATPEEIKGK